MDLHGQAEEISPSVDGYLIAPLASAAALDGAVFSRVNATEAIPATWEERARKSWEYYLEEPLVKNCVNSWRSFAVGDEIKITCDEEDVKWEAIAAAERLAASDFVKDMVLQLLVKGDSTRLRRRFSRPIPLLRAAIGACMPPDHTGGYPMSNQIPNRMEADQLAKALEAVAKLQDAADILRSLQKDSNGYTLKATFSHFASQIEDVLSVDNGEAGLTPWLKNEGG